jgi:hypothetical protein
MMVSHIPRYSSQPLSLSTRIPLTLRISLPVPCHMILPAILFSNFERLHLDMWSIYIIGKNLLADDSSYRLDKGLDSHKDIDR